MRSKSDHKNPYREKRKGRRQKAEVTSEMIEHVKKLGGLGLTREQIHNYYGMNSDSWQLRVKESPELESAMLEGKSRKIEFAAGKLWEHIERGNLAAIMFFLKTQAHWREVVRPGEEGSANGSNSKLPSIMLTITDPNEAAKIYQQIMIGS